MKYYLFIIAFFVFQFSFSQFLRQSITTTGNWTKTFNVTDIANAGLDYNTSYVSATNQTRINASSYFLFWPINATVSIHKEDIEWHSDLNLEAKVSSITTSNFQSITNSETAFFTFSGRQNNIPIQYRISGLSVTLPVENYSTEVVYTIWDN